MLKGKVQLMEEEKRNGDAAVSLLKQFVETGFARQDDEGAFILPGLSGEKKFKPFEEDWTLNISGNSSINSIISISHKNEQKWRKFHVINI